MVVMTKHDVEDNLFAPDLNKCASEKVKTVGTLPEML